MYAAEGLDVNKTEAVLINNSNKIVAYLKYLSIAIKGEEISLRNIFNGFTSIKN